MCTSACLIFPPNQGALGTAPTCVSMALTAHARTKFTDAAGLPFPDAGAPSVAALPIHVPRIATMPLAGGALEEAEVRR